MEPLKQALVEADVRTAIDEWPNGLWRSTRANGGHYEYIFL
jgi:hypothetical protein